MDPHSFSLLDRYSSGSRRENLRKSLVHLQNTLRKVIFLQFFEARSGSALRKKLDLDADPQLSFSLDTFSLSISLFTSSVW